MHNPRTGDAAQLPFVQQGVRALGKELMVVEARAPEEFESALAKLAPWRADALIILESSLYFARRKTLFDLAAKYRWPTINSSNEYAEAGGVIAYGAIRDNCRRRSIVDKT